MSLSDQLKAMSITTPDELISRLEGCGDLSVALKARLTHNPDACHLEFHAEFDEFSLISKYDSYMICVIRELRVWYGNKFDELSIEYTYNIKERFDECRHAVYIQSKTRNDAYLDSFTINLFISDDVFDMDRFMKFIKKHHKLVLMHRAKVGRRCGECVFGRCIPSTCSSSTGITFLDALRLRYGDRLRDHKRKLVAASQN